MEQKRDENGRFVKGGGGGPGRPPRANNEQYYELMQSTCSPAEWRKIVKKAVEQAKRGNHPARKFLADYLLGPPLQRHEVLLKSLDLSTLSIAQLERISAGEDVLSVLATPGAS